jgi:hypothetical protein
MNMTQRQDGDWRALSNEELFKRTKLVGAAYRATLARELQIAGYGIRRTDGEGGFELAHISRTQIEAFSRRGQDIEEALKQRGKSRQQASTLEKQVITLATRPVKDRLRADDKHLLMEHWKQRSAAEGIGYDGREQLNTNLKRHDYPRESLDFAIAHLTERQSVMLDSMLMTTAMQHAVGQATHAELRTELNRRIADGSVIQEQPLYRAAVERDSTPPKTRFHFEAAMVQEERVPYGQAILKVTVAIAEGAIVKAEPRYTTAEAWQMERAILRLEQDGRYRLPPIMAAAAAEQALARTDLNRGQKDAARMLVTTSNRVTGIQGSAGVGKSHMLKSATAIAASLMRTTAILCAVTIAAAMAARRETIPALVSRFFLKHRHSARRILARRPTVAVMRFVDAGVLHELRERWRAKRDNTFEIVVASTP